MLSPPYPTAAQTPFIQGGAGAVSRTSQNKMREVVSLIDYLDDDYTPGSDASTAFAEAIAYLTSMGGGDLLIPPQSEDWLANIVIAANNIYLRGNGGSGEFDTTVIRPFSILSPTLTWGDGVSVYRYCGMSRLHISGTDGTVAGITEAAHNAPQAVLLNGGVVNLHINECVIYNGVQTLALVPSATQPVTTNTFFETQLRNDLEDSNDARTLYIKRLADPGYATANDFVFVKINGPDLGYAVELDGTAASLTASFINSYWDVVPDHGALLKNATLAGFNLEIDPGANGAVVVEVNSAVNKDPARYLQGYIRVGSQKMKFSDATTITFPDEGNNFQYRPRLSQPYLGDVIYFGSNADPYNTTIYMDQATAVGPTRLFGSDWYVKTTTQSTGLTEASLITDGGFSCAKDARIGGEFYIYGNNAAPGGFVTVAGGAGGLYFGAIGINQNIRFVPTGTGFSQFGGAGIYAADDNAQSLGVAGGAWSGVVSYGYSDQNGTQVVGIQQPAIANATDAIDVIARLNDLLAAVRLHGLIDT